MHGCTRYVSQVQNETELIFAAGAPPQIQWRSREVEGRPVPGVATGPDLL